MNDDEHEADIRARIDAAMNNQACTDMLNEVPYNDPDHCSTEEEIDERCMHQLKIDHAVHVSNQRRSTNKIIYHDFKSWHIGQ